MMENKEDDFKVEVEISGGQFFKDNKPSSTTLIQRIGWHHEFILTYPLTEDAQTLYSEITKPISIKLFAGKKGLSFDGIITGIEDHDTINGKKQVVIKGKSLTYKMERSKGFEAFKNQKTSALFKAIANRVGLPDGRLEIHTNDDVIKPYQVIYNESEFNFLARSAEWFYYDGQKIHWGRNPRAPEVLLFTDNNLKAFNNSLKVVPLENNYVNLDYENNHHKPIATQPCDSGKTNFLQKLAANFFGTPLMRSLLFHQSDKINVERVIQNKKNRRMSGMITAKGCSIEPTLAVGSIAVVNRREGEAERYFITSVTHTVQSNGIYHNDFSGFDSNSKIQPKSFLVYHPSANPEPAIIVDNNFKLGGHVKVKYPWMKKEQSTPPVRVISPQSENGTGHYYPMHIGSHCIVNYLNGDPTKPYIEGNTCHKDAKPNEVFSSEKALKSGMVSKSGSKLFFSDQDGEEHIIIATPNKKSLIKLSINTDESILLEASQGIIKIKAKNIGFEAIENINLSAKNISIQAKQKVFIEGHKGRFAFKGNLFLKGRGVVKMLFDKIFLN